MFVFNLHLLTCSLKNFSLILIGYGALGNQGLLANAMKRYILLAASPSDLACLTTHVCNTYSLELKHPIKE